MILKLLYWIAVVAISLALVVALILFLESRDASQVKEAAWHTGVTSSSAPAGARV
jgi:hypothetical protein